jgi:hypothetical protein
MDMWLSAFSHVFLHFLLSLDLACRGGTGRMALIPGEE